MAFIYLNRKTKLLQIPYFVRLVFLDLERFYFDYLTAFLQYVWSIKNYILKLSAFLQNPIKYSFSFALVTAVYSHLRYSILCPSGRYGFSINTVFHCPPCDLWQVMA